MTADQNNIIYKMYKVTNALASGMVAAMLGTIVNYYTKSQ